MASSRQPVLLGIFTSDHHKPSICYEEPGRAEGEPPATGSGAGQLPTLSDPEFMQLDEELAVEPDTPVDWRWPYLDYLLRLDGSHEVVVRGLGTRSGRAP
jgi:hypothetical protein